MRRVLFGLVFLLALPAWAGLPAPKVQKVNDRIYALLGPMEFPNPKNQGYMVNSTVIIGDTGVILIDTGFTDEIGKHLAKAIARITPKPVKYIINTHHHGDHTLGNVAFPGAQIISSEKCRSELEKTGAEWIQIVETSTGRKFPNTRPVLADTTYQENTRVDITLDGVRMVLWTPFGSHTAGDMLVYLPDDKVLVAGDVLVHRIMPAFRDAYVKNWVNTLEEVGKLDFRTVIPGHGPLMTKSDALKFHKMMARLYADVEAGYRKGLTDSEIRKTLDLSEWKRLKHFEESMGGNINRTYLEIEAANF